MNGDRTIYMDYAATSAVRPREVADAVHAFLTNCGGTPGRGGHRFSTEAGRTALRCRMALARLLGIPGDPGRISFMLNATHALNTALYGILRENDVVVHTAYDHNAVLRPLHYLARERGVRAIMLEGAPDGSIDMDALRKALVGARMLVINAVSNVLGTASPVAEMCAAAREAGAITLVDGAQAAGHAALHVGDAGIDMLAFTGHKGLLGPQGVGGLWVREGLDVAPLLTGGTGGNSAQRDMPDAYPDHLEAGSGNGPGIAGLLAGIEWIQRRGLAELHAHESALKARLREGLLQVPGIRVLSPAAPEGAALVTVVAEAMDASELTGRLDREHGVMTRSGLHCAPEAHRVLGTEKAGAVRFSVGWASTMEDVDAAIEAVAAVAGAVRA
jgi:cysteine desulfurase / selenocysteine lyase